MPQLHDIENICYGESGRITLQRVRVDGGWLYTQFASMMITGVAASCSCSTTFVPDTKENSK